MFAGMQQAIESVCPNCHQIFRPDSRNAYHQVFCARPPCQRARRSEMQRVRRRIQNPPRGPHDEGVYDAVMTLRNPLMIGLLSQLLGSVSMEEIEEFMRRLIRKGCDILDPQARAPIDRKRPKIGLFRRAQPKS